MQSQHEELKKQHSDLEEEHRKQGEDFSRTFNDHKQKYLQLQQEKEQELSKLKGIWKSASPVHMEISAHSSVAIEQQTFDLFLVCMVVGLSVLSGPFLATCFFVTFHIYPYLFGLLREAENS